MKGTLMDRTLAVFAVACSLLAGVAHACLWDRDTLAAEAKGLPGITEIITGRFDRFPTLFYEMRLERVTAAIVSDPDNLGLYDDAGVACDRLGRSDEAIAWMERKLLVMDRLESEGADVGEHRYRYLANLGTFLVHRWLKSGSDREDMTDVERSRELIAAAIELNPDAHFGRERYQLLAIEWILNVPDEVGAKQNLLHMIPLYRPYEFGTSDNTLSALGYADSVEGISGLIALGNAWQSPEIYRALAFSLADQGLHVLSTLSMIRVQDLTLRNAGDQLPDRYADRELMIPGHAMILDGYTEVLRAYYVDASEEASDWVDARNQYAMDRLERGVHPDTHSGFWDEWIEPSSAPDFPSMTTLSHNPIDGAFLALAGVGFVAMLLISGLIWLAIKGWSSLRS
tara:strand:+ start:471 stop:1667 length:1197 start_codon:yes stop_codon:yes gene_type:complete